MPVFNVIILLLVLLPVAAAQSASSARDNSHPAVFDPRAVVAVRVKGRSGFCSGALVTQNTILTATHCVYDLSKRNYFAAGDLQVGVGENIFSDDFSWFAVAAVEIDSADVIRSETDYLKKDIVHLILSQPQTIRPLVVANTLDNPSSLVAWGFGEDEWGYLGLLKSRPLENPQIEPELITFSAGACRGDSGGPILDSKFRVVGVISLSLVPHCVERGRRIAQRVWRE